MNRLKEAYQNDEGISWDELGNDGRESQAEMNRPMLMQLLGKKYLRSIPEVDTSLQEGGRVADIGAGFAWSSIGDAAHPVTKLEGVAQFPTCKSSFSTLAVEITTVKRRILTLWFEDACFKICWKDLLGSMKDFRSSVH
jgi:hypothetical protein